MAEQILDLLNEGEVAALCGDFDKNIEILKKEYHIDLVIRGSAIKIIGEEKDGMYRIEQRNKFSVWEQIEIMKPNGDNIEVTVQRIVNEDGQEQESAPHPKQVLYVDLGCEAQRYDILRRRD